jgi:hypothetical protein
MKAPRIVLAALLIAPTPLLLAGRGGAAQELGNYNGTVSATAVHVQAGSSAFPNFASGAVDNRYPLASAHLDSSPFANAVASPFDTGPLGQTVAASGQQNQPQYADVRCPPQCEDKPTTFGSPPGPSASAQAGERQAVAEARAAGVTSGGAPAPPGGGSAASPAGGPAAPTGGSSPALPGGGSAAVADAAPEEAAAPAGQTPGLPAIDSAQRAALRSALLGWRAQFLTADDARRYPMPAADAPDGVSGDTARSQARIDGSALLLDGTTSVGELVLGGGALVLRGVHVTVSVTNDGTPKKTVAVDIGSALVGGTPVTIGAGGVSVNGQELPGIAEAGAQASEALNQALAKAGFEVRSLGPSEQLSDHQLTLDAVGVLIRIAPASPAPGVPANFTAVAVGEVFADSLAGPGDAAGELDDGLPDIGDAASVTAPDTATASADAGAEGPADLGTAGDGATGADGASGLAGPSGAFGSAAGSFSPGVAAGAGSARGSSGGSPAGQEVGLAAPAASRHLMGRQKPVKLLLLYLLWQSLVIGTVASLYLWRKVAV